MFSVAADVSGEPGSPEAPMTSFRACSRDAYRDSSGDDAGSETGESSAAGTGDSRAIS